MIRGLQPVKVWWLVTEKTIKNACFIYLEYVRKHHNTTRTGTTIESSPTIFIHDLDFTNTLCRYEAMSYHATSMAALYPSLLAAV
jgi:hypothetical protein